MRYTDDPAADWDAYCREQDKALENLPYCCHCGERIEDDFCFDFFGDVYCEECCDKLFRKYTIDMMG